MHRLLEGFHGLKNFYCIDALNGNKKIDYFSIAFLCTVVSICIIVDVNYFPESFTEISPSSNRTS